MVTIVSVSIYRYVRKRAAEDPKFRVLLDRLTPMKKPEEESPRSYEPLHYSATVYNLGNGCRWIRGLSHDY